MKQLIQDPTEDQDSSSIAKPNESEKQARRIAHTPKVIRLSDQPPTESAVSEPIDCNLQRGLNDSIVIVCLLTILFQTPIKFL